MGIARRSSALGAAILVAVTLSAAPPGRRGPDDLNILLVTLDTTRADHLGCYGDARAVTPNLDALASRGIRFANAYAQVPLTLPSHCSIMTGTYPLVHQVHNNGSYYLGSRNPTLAEILGRRGYATAAFVSSFTLDSRFGIARGFDLYDDQFQADEVLKSFRSERNAEAVFAPFSEWLSKNGRKKFFCWLHFYDPHLPYDPPSPFKEKFRDRKYDGEIAYVDSVLGKVLDRLRDEGLLDNTLIIVAGDHGEGLGEKKEIDHGLFLYDGTLRVPLIFSSGRSLPASVVVASRVRLIDILPTVLDTLGMSSPKGIQGTSLLPYIRGRRKDDLPSYVETYFPRENYGWSELRGLIDGPWKLILAPRPELYNLMTDPREKNNVIQENAAVEAADVRKIEDLAKEAALPAGAGRRAMSAEEKERLRSLGYLGGAEPGRAGKGLADPKDKIEDYLLVFRGNLMENEGELEKAADCYREVLLLNPGVPTYYVNLAFLYTKMNRFAEAVGLLEQARSRFPESVTVLSRLMGLYLKDERWKDALQAGRAALAVDPMNFDALFLSGTARAKLGEWEEALSCYRKALDIEPENGLLRRRWAYSLMASGRHREALEAYRRLQQAHPEDPAIAIDMARLHELLGERGRALEILGAVVLSHPAPEAFYAYALLLGKDGQLKEAVRWIKLYLDNSPKEETPQKDNARRLLMEWLRDAKAP